MQRLTPLMRNLSPEKISQSSFPKNDTKFDSFVPAVRFVKPVVVKLFDSFPQ